MERIMLDFRLDADGVCHLRVIEDDGAIMYADTLPSWSGVSAGRLRWCVYRLACLLVNLLSAPTGAEVDDKASLDKKDGRR